MYDKDTRLFYTINTMSAQWCPSDTRGLVWGLLSQFALLRYFLKFSSLSKNTLTDNIAFIFHMCHRSSAPGTHVKYECDSRNLACTFARSKIFLTEKLTNGALVTPTPGLCSVPWLLRTWFIADYEGTDPSHSNYHKFFTMQPCMVCVAQCERNKAGERLVVVLLYGADKSVSSRHQLTSSYIAGSKLRSWLQHYSTSHHTCFL